MARIILLTPAELTRDPRARRAAVAAVARDWEVVGICPVSGGPAAELADVSIFRIGGGALESTLRNAGLGGGRPDRPFLRELRGVYRLLRLARLTVGLVRRGRRLGHADVVHANDFDTLPAGHLLSRALNARLVYDAHELYTLQEADPPRFYTSVVRYTERLLARHTDAVITVSEPIADELQAILRLERRPFVVLNCPARSEIAHRPEAGSPLRAVYQGSIGLGRSLDDLLDAAAATVGVELALRIIGVDADSLRSRVHLQGLSAHVRVLDPVSPADLVEALSEFDVGVIITRPLSRNDELAAPNKLFEYLMAGLAVVAPRLPGIEALVADEGVAAFFEPGSPTALGQVLTRLASSPVEVVQSRVRARALAMTTYNAEAQQPILARAWAA